MDEVTLALDRELGESGIKVGGICPGGVKTEFAIGKVAPKAEQPSMPDPEDVWCGAPGLAHGLQNCVLLRCRCAR
jgi:short-subunit dehydrogenase